MQKLIDITGERYGKLTVLGFDHIGNRRRSYWKCKCDCGREIVLRKDEFIYPYSHSVSCGCWHREESSKRPRNTISGKYTKINKKQIKFLNETKKDFEIKRGERGQTNMKIFKVKVTLTDEKEKIEIVSAEDELAAIDLVMKKYNSKDVLDIKVV